jgi:hypothetical protein
MRSTGTIHEPCTCSERFHARSPIRKLTRVAVAAVRAGMVCFPMLLAAHPGTPLRMLGITAFEYLARLRGGTLGRQRRLAMAHACDFASLRNDYYDHQTLDASEYRALRFILRHMAPEASTARYIQSLRQAERNRPILAPATPNVVDAVIGYRTRVLNLTLQWLQEIAAVSVDAVKFNAFLSVASLTQIGDDLLDWKDDQASSRPSYVTAILFNQPSRAVAVVLRVEADALLKRTLGAARQDAGAMPFAVAGVLTWAFVVALIRLRFRQ